MTPPHDKHDEHEDYYNQRRHSGTLQGIRLIGCVKLGSKSVCRSLGAKNYS
jgi:hypothetical protein